MRAGRNLDKLRSGLKIAAAPEVVRPRGGEAALQNHRLRKYQASCRGRSSSHSTSRRGPCRQPVPPACPRPKAGVEERTKAPAPAAEFETDARDLLDRLSSVAAACSSIEGDGPQCVADMSVQRLANEAWCSVWIGQPQGRGAVPCVCSRAELRPGVSPEAAVWSIYSIEERLQWDGASFVQYDALRLGDAQAASGALADAVYCRMRAPAGISDRDVVQDRFLLKTQGGGYAIVMRSTSEERSVALGRPPSKGLARARTHLSGYVLEPSPSGGVLLTAVSQTELGGNIPSWMQNLAKKAGKRKMLEWTRMLEAHCLRPASDEVVKARRALLARLDSFAEASDASACSKAFPEAASGGSTGSDETCGSASPVDTAAAQVVRAEKGAARTGVVLLAAACGLALSVALLAASLEIMEAEG